MTDITETRPDIAPADALDERLIAAAIGVLELYSVHLGRVLGLYPALTTPTTVDGLAQAAGVDPRYAREWLEQQAVAGFVSADDSDDWSRRVYWLSDQQKALFVTATDPSHVSPLADMVAGIGNVIDQVAGAYRSGGGVPYRDYGTAFRQGQAGINRPAFTHDLPTTWVAATPDVADRLIEGGKVLDLGCGAGWSTIAMAAAFPESEVIGIDADEESIADARRNADEAGVSVRFELGDAASLNIDASVDLVLILEALHDMAQPVEALVTARRLLTTNGAVIIADEQVAEVFSAPGEDLDRLMYGFSVSHCLPASMAEADSAAVGTVIRPGLVRSMAEQSGFGTFEQTEIDGGFFNIYVLRP